MTRLSTEEKRAENKKYESALALARTYCQNHKDGGVLHVVLEDGNIDDFCIQAAISRAQSLGDADGLNLANTLLTLTVEQRIRLVNER